MVDRLITSYPPPTAPGIYGIISSAGPATGPSGLGIVALVGKASFGPIGTAVPCGSTTRVQQVYGNASSVDRSITTSTMANLAREASIGGAIGFVAVRVGGTGGTTASVIGGVMDNASTVTGQFSAASPGVFGNSLSVFLRAVAGAPTQKERVVMQGTTIVQNSRFAAGTPPDEAAALAAATVGAPYVVFTKSAVGSGVLATISPAAVLSGGADPSVSPSDYGNAFAALSPHAWATLVTDSEDPNVAFKAIASYVDTETLSGRFRTACVGEATNVAVATRYADASAINSPLVRYAGSGFTYPNGDGTSRTVEGYLAAAVDAGILSTLTPGTSMTWRTIPGATGIVVGTPAYDEATAITAGMGYYKYSQTMGVRTGAGISTLVNPGLPPIWATGLNPGWKYLEHVATAFGLLGEIGDTWESMVANPNPLQRPPNTPAGRDALTAAANRTSKKYIDNSWIQSGDVIVDPSHPSTSNTAYFTFENLVVALRAERLVLALPFGTP
jgi:hypothetical protein